MKVKVENIELEGADVGFEFSEGLNFITGPISSGKTTLLECIRGILGSTLRNLSDETRKTVSSLRSKVHLGGSEYTVIRPYKTTKDAVVTVGGNEVAKRLPVAAPSAENPVTYRHWIMEQLELPRLRMANSPTKIDTNTSPVTINDYMMYSHMPEGEIDRNIIGSKPWKNNKRKIVFKIAYGVYTSEVAELEEKIREKKRKLRDLENRSDTIEEVLKDTVFENRSKIVEELENEREKLSRLKEESVREAEEISKENNTIELRDELEDIKTKIQSKSEEINNINRSIEKKRENSYHS